MDPQVWGSKGEAYNLYEEHYELTGSRIYNEIGPGQRIALSKLAVETYEKNGRPLRLAIDISIWLFQIQSGKGRRHGKTCRTRLTNSFQGGTNPALRTFYYRLLRLISLSIHPLFVFDGPNKPPFKRGKRTGPNVASIPDFLAKQLLKQFGLPFHLAPGEAEAECALLQRRGVVDAVLSEDVDTLMFGSGLTLRNWSPEGSLKSKVATHVNLYDAAETKAGKSGLDREGMVLVALMSGGDYVPEGIQGCGPKTACEAARAGFGTDLCKISKKDNIAIAAWKTRLCHELKTNESRFFRSKHMALLIPEDFPRLDILGYYTHPVLSSDERIDRLKETLKWDQDFDIPALRTFVGEAFEWICLSGGKKFIRNLAPALLVKELRLRAEKVHAGPDVEHGASLQEEKLIKHIHIKRNHVTTDGITELRVSFVPNDLVKLDLDAEEPDPEVLDEEINSDDEEVMIGDDLLGTGDPSSPKKKRAPSKYDPLVSEKVWLLETFVKIGVPLKMQDWEENMRGVKQLEAAKTAKRALKKPKPATDSGVNKGTLDAFTRVTKPGVSLAKAKSKSVSIEGEDMTSNTQVAASQVSDQQTKKTLTTTLRPTFKLPPLVPEMLPDASMYSVIDLLSSPDRTLRPPKRVLSRFLSDISSFMQEVGVKASLVRPDSLSAESTANGEDAPVELPASITVRRHRSPFRRTQSTSTAEEHDILPPLPEQAFFAKRIQRASSPGLPELTDLLSGVHANSRTPLAQRQPTMALPKLPTTPKRTDRFKENTITISSSPETPKSQRSIQHWFAVTPTRAAATTKMQTRCAYDEKDMFLPRPVVSNFTTAVQINDAGGSSLEYENNASAVLKTLVSFQKPLERVKEVIRLRDSLDGAWEADEGASSTTRGKDGGKPSPERKRKRSGRREWRVSQVETLDLTAT